MAPGPAPTAASGSVSGSAAGLLGSPRLAPRNSAEEDIGQGEEAPVAPGPAPTAASDGRDIASVRANTCAALIAFSSRCRSFKRRSASRRAARLRVSSCRCNLSPL